MEIQDQNINNNNPREEDEAAAAAAANNDPRPPPGTASLIDTVTIIPPDAQRCRRNSGQSGWRCKNSSGDNNLQYCQQHYDSRKNNPPSKKKQKNKKKKKLDPSDDDDADAAAPVSAPIKLKIRRRRDDGPGCSGGGGGEAGGSDCCLEKRSRRKTKKLDCPCCVNSTHVWEELGICVDLDMNCATATEITPEINADAAVVNDLGHNNEGRDLEKVVVPADELRCRRNDGVNWRCKNYWSGANDLKYCDKHYATRVVGLRRKSTPRKSKPANVEWGIQTKSVAIHLGGGDEVGLDSESMIDEDLVDSKVELESGEKSDGNHAIEEEKVVVSVEKKGNGDGEGGDLGNGGGLEETNGYVPKEEENVVQEIKKKNKKKKLKKSNPDEGGGAGKSESEIKDKMKKKKKKKKRKREIDSIFGVLSSMKPRKVAEGDQYVNEMPIQGVQSVNETAIQEATNDTYDSDGILEAFAEIGKKKMKVETTKKVELKRCSGELKSSTKSKERLVELEKSLQHYKRMWLEMSVELEKKKMECVDIQGKLVDVESRKVVADDEFKKYKKARRKRDERAQEKVIYLEGKIEMIENDLERGKRRAEDETEYWKKKFCDLETRVLKMEDGNSTLRFVETHKSEKIESEVRGVQNENQSDKSNTSEPDAEASGGRNGSHVVELQTKKNTLDGNGIDINKHPEAESSLPEHSALDVSSNSGHISCGGEQVEEEKGGHWEERISQHGSSSQKHLELSKKRSVNGVSESDGEHGQSLEDSDTCSSDSKISLGDVMDKLPMKYKDRNIYKRIKWEIETDMISSFEKDPELCMIAVCALFRQQRSEEKITADWLFHYSDALRGSTLAEFLMDGDRRGGLKKSVEELDKFDTEGREDCKRLAKSYSKQLFRIYQNKEDPFFHPSSTTIP